MCLHAALSCMACASRALLATLMPSLIGAVPGITGWEGADASPPILCKSLSPRLPALEDQSDESFMHNINNIKRTFCHMGAMWYHLYSSERC